MLGFIRDGGYPMLVLLVIVVIAAVLVVRAWLRLRALTGPDAKVETGIDAVLFWGFYAVVVGVLGTLVGVAQAAGAIERAQAVSTQLIWGGIKVALSTTIFGLVTFSLALLVWFALRVRYRHLVGPRGA